MVTGAGGLAISAGSAVGRGIGNLITVVGQASGTDKPDAFFPAVKEQDVAAVTVLSHTNTHPDAVLRRLGVIESHGRYNDYPVWYSARHGEWRYETNDQSVHGLTSTDAAAHPEKVTMAWDKTPAGVIRVQGSLLRAVELAPHLPPVPESRPGTAEAARAADSAARVTEDVQELAKLPANDVFAARGSDIGKRRAFRSDDVVQRIRREKERDEDRRERRRNAEDDDSEAAHAEGDTSSDESDRAEAMTGKDLKHAFEQYLLHGVVEAARLTGSCIFSPGSGDIAQLLAGGIYANNDKNIRGQGMQATEIRTGRILLVGISPWSPELDDNRGQAELNRLFTHHIVVERDTKPDSFDPTVTTAGVSFLRDARILHPILEEYRGNNPQRSRDEELKASKRFRDWCNSQGTQLGACKVCRCSEFEAMRLRLVEGTGEHKKEQPANSDPFASDVNGWGWTIPCSGFRCEHVHDSYKPVLPDDDEESSGGRPVHPQHCRVPVSYRPGGRGGAAQVDVVDPSARESGLMSRTAWEKTWDDKQSDSGWNSARLDVQRHWIAQSFGPADRETQAMCWRRCECGFTLGPLELARCVCGRFDFEHIPKEVKRQRFRRLGRSLTQATDQDQDRQRAHLAWLAYFAAEVTRQPTQAEVHRYTTQLIGHLARGFSQSAIGPNMKHAPPTRKGVPAVTVLFNGDASTEKFDLVRQVQHRWPIVCIAGSGGYADILADTMSRVKKIVSDREAAAEAREGGSSRRKGPAGAGLDDYRRFLSSVDSLTAEIIISGKVEVMRRGTNNKEFVRRLEICLGGDETLQKAWAKYAKWQRNAQQQQVVYETGQSRVLIMQCCTTFLSCTQTFVKLLCATLGDRGTQCPGFQGWPVVPDTPAQTGWAPSQWVLWVLWVMLEWAIIAFPIAISFVQALINKEQAGAKYVQLKEAAEKLLSEIYKYRTKTLGYSTEEIQRHSRKYNRGSDSKEADATGLFYTSREELLELKVRELTDSLTHSDEVSHMTLDPYSGDLPPPHIRHTGDVSHLADLAPTDYIRYRLQTKLADLSAEAEVMQRRIELAHVVIFFCNGAGTLLAAIAAYGLGYVQAWVALTTALATSLTRYLDYRRLEWRLKRSNKLVGELDNICSWWASLGSGSDNRENRDDLVGQSERLIVDQTSQWAQQVQSALERAVQTEEERQREREKAMEDYLGDRHGDAERDMLREVGATHGVDLDDLSADHVLGALSDPSKVKKLHMTLHHLAQKGLAPIPTEVVLHRTAQGQDLGVIWRDEKQLVLKGVVEGSPADEAAAIRFKDRRCTHVNGAVVADEAGFKSHATQGSVSLTFDKQKVPSTEETIAVAVATGQLAGRGGRQRVVHKSTERLLYEMRLPSVGFCDHVPLGEIRDAILHHDTRIGFLLAIKAHRQVGMRRRGPFGGEGYHLSRWGIMQCAQEVPDFYRVIKEVRTRQLLEIVKCCAVEQLIEDLCGKVQSVGSQLRRVDVIPKVADGDWAPGGEDDPFVAAEAFVSEMRLVALTLGAESLDANSVVNLIKNPKIKAVVRRMDERMRSQLRTAAQDTWSQRPTNDQVSLLEEMVERIASHDMEELLDSPEVRIKMWSKLQKIKEFRKDGELAIMSKQQLFEYVPAAMAKQIGAKSQMQVQEYLVRLAKGTSASQVFRALRVADVLSPDSTEAEFAVAHALDSGTDDSAELRERFIATVSGVRQADINRMSKGVLVRKLKVSTMYDSRVEEMISALSEPNLRQLMSSIHSRMHDLYAPRIVDRLADRVHSFDVRELIHVGNARKLVRKSQEFRMISGDARVAGLRSLDKLELLRMLGSPALVSRLELLSKQQLCEMLEAMLSLVVRSFSVRILRELRGLIGRLPRDDRTGRAPADDWNYALQEWDADYVDHLLDALPDLDLGKLRAAVDAKPGTPLSEHVAAAAAQLHLRRRGSQLDQEIANGLERFEVAARARRQPGGRVQEYKDISDVLLNFMEHIKGFQGEEMMSRAFEAVAMMLEVADVGDENDRNSTASRSPASSPGSSPRFELRRRQSEARNHMVEGFENVFKTQEQRTEMLRRLCRVPVSQGLELHTLFLETPGGDGADVRERSAQQILKQLQEDLRSEGGEDLALDGLAQKGEQDSLRLPVAQIVCEFTLGGPLRFFQALASRLRPFDVRDVVGGFSNRRRLSLLIYELIVSPWAPADNFELIARPLPPGSQVRVCEQLTGRPFAQLPPMPAGCPVPWEGEEGRGLGVPQRTADRSQGEFVYWYTQEDLKKRGDPAGAWDRAGQWRSDFFRRAASLRSPPEPLEPEPLDGNADEEGARPWRSEVYDAVITDLRTLSEPQLKLLVEECYILLTRVDAGRLLCHYLKCAGLRQGLWKEQDTPRQEETEGGASADAAESTAPADAAEGGAPADAGAPAGAEPGPQASPAAGGGQYLAKWAPREEPLTDGEIRWDDWIVLTDAIVQLKEHARVRESDVSGAFLKYNESAFAAQGGRHQERRVAALRALLEDEKAISLISKMTPRQLRDEVFIHLTGALASMSLPAIFD
eukprot:TRINITY_DN8631_c0_g1_i2.p1 TRINITY_DN8631_c0_g1~~TRINITY_DN8631_c0_g1_i2.p1  ORF type:complete len:2529 (+),score=706.24 TRINITY_DN8631_c0_g1_i2:171-7757(+)